MRNIRLPLVSVGTGVEKRSFHALDEKPRVSVLIREEEKNSLRSKLTARFPKEKVALIFFIFSSRSMQDEKTLVPYWDFIRIGKKKEKWENVCRQIRQSIARSFFSFIISFFKSRRRFLVRKFCSFCSFFFLLLDPWISFAAPVISVKYFVYRKCAKQPPSLQILKKEKKMYNDRYLRAIIRFMTLLSVQKNKSFF